MNIGQESEAFVAEPLPEQQPQEVETPEHEEVLVPVAAHEAEREAASA